MKKHVTIPNLLTSLGLLFGILSVYSALAGNFIMAGVHILLAMVCDFADGKVARATKQTSEFGKQLDSLADLVSFGIAPPFLVCTIKPGMPLVFGALLFGIAAAWRLARHNIQQENDYIGLPAPAAAFILVLIAFGSFLFTVPFGVIFGAELILAGLMVSTFKLKKW